MNKLITKHQFGGISQLLDLFKNKTKSLISKGVDFIEDAAYKILRYLYIQALENPNLIGYDAANNKWTKPTDPGYDENQIGIGLDTKYNKDVIKFLKDNNREKDPWLTDEEMRALQNKSIDYYEKVLDRRLKGLKISPNKRTMAIGMLYRGDGPKLWDSNEAVHKALFKGTDEDMLKAVYDFYNGKLTERAESHNNFWK